MSLSARAAWLVAFVPLYAADAFADCSKRELRAGDTITAELTHAAQIRERPAFYLRVPSVNTVLFFRPEDVLTTLASRLGQRPRMLDLLRADLPLRENTDLYKYVVNDDSALWPMEYVVATLLTSGRVSVDYWPLSDTRHDPMTIKVVRWSKTHANGRKFCDEAGHEFYVVLDEIE